MQADNRENVREIAYILCKAWLHAGGGALGTVRRENYALPNYLTSRKL